MFSNYGTMNKDSNSVVDSSNFGGRTGNDISTDPKFDQILSEQDRGLDSLHTVIVRSRRVAENIETEVGVQNEIIDGLGKIKIVFSGLSFNL